jgi:MFS family permease
VNQKFQKNLISRNTAIQFVILLGLIDFFADVTYEGGRSITGQYLAVLGASSVVVGILSGFGEFMGYGFRLVSGYVSDKTGRYWSMIFIGYFLNLLAVPLIALAGNWPLAAALILLERFGKAIRAPVRDAMLSYATHTIGRGWGFGLHDVMDKAGAIVGPLIVSAILFYRGSYQIGFAVLFIPAICSLSLLALARFLYPRPQDLEIDRQELSIEKRFTSRFWLYIVAICCIAAGYIDFPLMAFHFERKGSIAPAWVPVIYSFAMASSGISALVFGRLYDKLGLTILMWVTALASVFPFLVFTDHYMIVCIGILLWGLGIGAQESIMRAVVANMVSKEIRGTAYGILNIWFGLFWFLGSALMGFLYQAHLSAMIFFSFGMQLIAIPILLFLILKR